MNWLCRYQLLLLLQFVNNISTLNENVLTIDVNTKKLPTLEVPRPLSPLDFDKLDLPYIRARKLNVRVWKTASTRKPSLIDVALQVAAKEGLDAMANLYRNIEPEIAKNGQLLADNHPAALLSKFSAPAEGSEQSAMAAYAAIAATKAFRRNCKESTVLGRGAQSQKVSFRRTPLEGLCPPREPPTCMPAAQRYRTHDGTCNNRRRPRWGSAQMPFNRFLPPEYGDGVDSIRGSVEGGPLSSARFVSLLVHGAREGDASLTLMIAQWGQLLDHDMTSTAQPRSINGSVPSCCGSKDFHPSCFPIKVPLDDPWLAPLKVRCLEFLRSAPAQRRDCVLSWREQTNQVTSFIDASPIYSSNAKTSDNARTFRNGLLVYGRGNPADDVCMRGALAHQCIRSGDGRSGEQPGLLALHHVLVGEHNRIAMELSNLNPHWSDEKVYQETRRIIGALFQHITYREFLPIVLGREVCKLFDIELLNSGFYAGYDPNTNPSVSNAFAAAAFRFGHSLVQNSYMRCDRHHNFINNNVTLHEEFQQGDIGTAGSLHRLIRGLATQKALKRDEFITPELTNHLFQTPGFPFGLDLAAINIQRGRDHGVAPYTSWRQPCGLTPITTWDDLANVVGPESAKRISHAYRNVHDIDLFVGGIAERPVVGGLVGPTFACIIAQQFSNSRKGDRFWYENPGFESSFTPAQLHSIRHITLSSILCRAVGGGTFQPHVFIPSDIPDNQRVECGKGHLAPLDLRPWLEQDPFTVTDEKKDTPVSSPISHEPPKPVELPIQVIKEEKGINNRVHNITMVTHVDFIPNGAIGFHRVPNMTKIHDKLDIAQKIATRPIQKPFQGISNKLDKGRLPLKKLPKPNTTTRRTVVIHNVEIELRSAAPKAQKNKKKKTDKEKQRELIASAAQNTILRVAGVVKSQMNAVIGALEPRNGKEGILAETTTLQPTYDQTTTDTQIDLDTTKEILDTTDSSNLATELPLQTTTDTLTQNSTSQQTKLSTSPSTDISRQTNQKYEDFQLKIDTALHNQTDQHKRVHRSPTYLNFKVQGVELTTHLDFADKLRTLQLDKTDTFTGRHLSDDQFDYPFEARSDDLDDTDTTNSTNSDANLQNETTILTRANHKTPAYTGGIRKIELRKYQERPIYNRPQKVLLDGPNSDQYEIEINIRQTNTKAPSLNDNYVDYSNPNKRFELDRHDYDYPHTQTTSSQNYYTQTPRAPLVTRTKPPTVIYINEHDERPTTTIRPPGFFQNLFSFATNGFNNHNKPTEPSNSPFHHTPNRVETSGSGPEVEHLSPLSNYVSSPSSKPSSASYFNSAQNHPFSQSKPTSGSYLSGQQVESYPPQNFPQNGPSSFGPVNGLPPPHAFSPPQALPPPHAFSPPQALPPPHPYQPPNVFPLPALPGANSFSTASNVGGVSHASSSAVSTGHFGTIVGSAAISGSDSTFSFNIRPSSRPQPNLVSPTGIRPNYERFPPRQSQLSSTPSYAVPPKPISTVESFHYPPNRQDPFSGHTRRPPFHNERPTNVFQPAYEDFGRSELKIDKNGNIEGKTNGTKNDESLESSEYDYVDDDNDYETSDNADETENDADETGPAKKFDKDGYLRPEHMAANLFKQTLVNKTTVNATGFNDNFVLPVLIQNNQFNKAQTKANDSVQATNDTFYPDIEQKSLHNDILAEDYDELLTSQTSLLAARTADRGEKRRRPAINLQVAFAPIKVLTKPERPDNWVIFDTEEEKPLLPVLPEMNSETLVAAEVPMPFGVGSISTTKVPLTNKLTVPNKTSTDQNIKEQTTAATDENTTIHDGRTDLSATSPDATTKDTTDVTTFVTDRVEQVTEQMFNNDIDSTFDNYSENVDEDNFYLTTTEDISKMTDLMTELTTNPDEQTANDKTEEQNYAIDQPTTELSTEQMTEESTTKDSTTQRTELVTESATNDSTNQFQNLQTEVNLT